MPERGAARIPPSLVPLGLFGLALTLRLAVLWLWPFDGLYGQDAYAYYGQALAIARGLLPRDFFWPSGYPLLAAMGMRLLGEGPGAAQVTNVLLGAALAPLVYTLGRALVPAAGTRAALWAGLMVAVAGQPVLSSLVTMADMSGAFWATLAAWLLVLALTPVQRAGSRVPVGPTWMLLLAGLALGMAVVSRWVYALLSLPFAAYALLQAERVRGWRLGLPVAGGLSVFLCQVWLSQGRPEGLLHPWLLSWDPGNAWARAFSHLDGHYSYALPVAMYYLQPLYHPGYLVPLLGLAAIWGAWSLGRERNWRALLMLTGWSGVIYLFLAGIPYQNFRFSLSLYSPLVLLAGVGVEALAAGPPAPVVRWLRARNGPGAWARGVRLVAALSLLIMALWALRSAGRFITAQNQAMALARQVEEALPDGATVLTFSLTLTLQHYTDLDVIELYHLDDEALEAATTDGPTYLLLDLGNVAGQWEGRPPAHNYLWLQEHRMLTALADFPPYTLFRIDRGQPGATGPRTPPAANVSQMTQGHVRLAGDTR